jgi:hypothetical protein
MLEQHTLTYRFVFEPITGDEIKAEIKVIFPSACFGVWSSDFQVLSAYPWRIQILSNTFATINEDAAAEVCPFKLSFT